MSKRKFFETETEAAAGRMEVCAGKTLASWNRLSSAEAISAIRASLIDEKDEAGTSRQMDLSEPSETTTKLLRQWFGGEYAELWTCLDCCKPNDFWPLGNCVWYRTRRAALKHRLICVNANDSRLSPRVACFSALVEDFARNLAKRDDSCDEWRRFCIGVMSEYPERYREARNSAEWHPKLPSLEHLSDPYAQLMGAEKDLVSILNTIAKNQSICDEEECPNSLSKELKSVVSETGANQFLKRSFGPDFSQIWVCSGCALRNEVYLLNLLYRQLKNSPNLTISFCVRSIGNDHLKLSANCAKRGENALCSLSQILVFRAREILSEEVNGGSFPQEWDKLDENFPDEQVSDEALDRWLNLKSTIFGVYPYLFCRSLKRTE